jgi:hypothetical protein
VHSKYYRWLWIVIPVIIFIPYFRVTAIPIHDTLWKYQYFHFFYSHLVSFQEIPLWVPYGSYGIASGFSQLTLVSPSNYFFAAIGVLFGISNTLILFKFSVLLDFIIFIGGIYLFSSEFYRSKQAVIFAMIAAAGSFSWIVQSHLNFYIFYLMPLAAWAAEKFLVTGDLKFIGFLMLIEGITFVGNVPYFAPLHLLVLTILVIVSYQTKKLSGNQRENERRRLPLIRDWLHRITLRSVPLTLFAAILVGVVLCIVAYNSLQGTIVLAEGRDPSSFAVPPMTFLNYGRLNPGTSVLGMLAGVYPNADNTYYIGLLTPILVFWGLYKLDNPIFLSLVACAVALFWLSIGGWFAKLIYYFPGMMLYRHIGLTFGLSGILLILAGGFVVDKLVTGYDTVQTNSKLKNILKIILLAIAADLLFNWRKDDILILEPIQSSLLIVFGIKIILYVAFAVFFVARFQARKNQNFPITPKLFIAFFIADILTFQIAVQYTIPQAKANYSVKAFEVDRLRFLAVRNNELALRGEGEQRLSIITEQSKYPHSATYAFGYVWLGVDPCAPIYRNDLWQKAVVDAITESGGTARQQSGADFLPSSEKFRQDIGCNVSKLRLIKNYTTESSDSEKNLLKTIADQKSMLVIKNSSEPTMTYIASNEIGSPSSIDVVYFNANKLKAKVKNDTKAPAWLYYADAFDERWLATLDGVSTNVYKANVGFKAVLIPPGEHEVLMQFGGGEFSSNALALVGFFCLIFLVGWLVYRLALIPRHTG